MDPHTRSAKKNYHETDYAQNGVPLTLFLGVQLLNQIEGRTRLPESSFGKDDSV